MNSPEYTTSAPVIGPLIMCSGLRVSAKPYHPRHRVAPSSRVVVARQSIDRSLESRLVSSRLVLPRASSPRVVSSRIISLIHHPSIHHHRASSRSRRLARVSRVSRVARTASTNPQFATGPQKCVVFGPVGPSMKARIDMIAPSPSSPSLVALCHREVGRLSQSVSQSVINHPVSFMHARRGVPALREWRREGRGERRTDERSRDGARAGTSRSVPIEDASSSRYARRARRMRRVNA